METKEVKKIYNVNDVVERGTKISKDKQITNLEKQKEKVKKNKNKEVNKQLTKMSVLSTDLTTVLENENINLLPIDEKGSRKKIVDWELVSEECRRVGWCTIKQISSYVQENFELTDDNDQPRELHYSECLRFIRTSSKLWNCKVKKKEIKSGEHKGVYYHFSLK